MAGDALNQKVSQQYELNPGRNRYLEIADKLGLVEGGTAQTEGGVFVHKPRQRTI